MQRHAHNPSVAIAGGDDPERIKNQERRGHVLRILEAATQQFPTCGLSGPRVDAIANGRRYRRAHARDFALIDLLRATLTRGAATGILGPTCTRWISTSSLVSNRLTPKAFVGRSGFRTSGETLS